MKLALVLIACATIVLMVLSVLYAKNEFLEFQQRPSTMLEGPGEFEVVPLDKLNSYETQGSVHALRLMSLSTDTNETRYLGEPLSLNQVIVISGVADGVHSYSVLDSSFNNLVPTVGVAPDDIYTHIIYRTDESKSRITKALNLTHVRLHRISDAISLQEPINVVLHSIRAQVRSKADKYTYTDTLRATTYTTSPVEITRITHDIDPEDFKASVMETYHMNHTLDDQLELEFKAHPYNELITYAVSEPVNIDTSAGVSVFSSNPIHGWIELGLVVNDREVIAHKVFRCEDIESEIINGDLIPRVTVSDNDEARWFVGYHTETAYSPSLISFKTINAKQLATVESSVEKSAMTVA